MEGGGDASGNVARREALRRTDLLDSRPEEAFDRLARIATEALDAPAALISLIDGERELIKACVGPGAPRTELRELPLSRSFCRHVVESGEPLVVADARGHPLFSDDPVAREMSVAACCAVPLESPGGRLPGVICVIDHESRQWSDRDLSVLEDVAGAVRTEIALRSEVEDHERDLETMARNRRRLERVLETTIDGIVLIDSDGTITYANAAAEKILGLESSQIEGRSYRDPDWEMHDLAGERLEEADLPVGRVITTGDVVQGQEIQLRVGGDGDWRVLSVNAAPVGGGERLDEVVATFRDVTRRKRAEEELRHRALHDSLTGLPNRALFFDRLEHALARIGRRGGSCAVLFLDLDGFKAVNDRHGHAAGDRVLVVVGDRLRGCLREPDTVARIGGDEFTVLLEGPEGKSDVQEVVTRVLEAVTRPVQIEGGQEVVLGASVGVARYGGDEGREPVHTAEDRADELVRRADQAMYRAKEQADRQSDVRTASAFYGEG